MLTIHVHHAEHGDWRQIIDTFPCRIGRQPGNELVLTGWRVARLHAQIHQIGASYQIRDCGSLGGTWVNGERLQGERSGRRARPEPVAVP